MGKDWEQDAESVRIGKQLLEAELLSLWSFYSHKADNETQKPLEKAAP